ncbi:hypothetical protein ACFQBQ_07745 [Granulicella cerasi]|uniref:Uncharacterized protein n=1 Tax=Granulicella cerasi TaxID=741063 RepID=A0ABW1Z9A8_9BACT|nr:hypothetical protein [Granulicella cerasi]
MTSQEFVQSKYPTAYAAFLVGEGYIIRRARDGFEPLTHEPRATPDEAWMDAVQTISHGTSTPRFGIEQREAAVKAILLEWPFAGPSAKELMNADSDSIENIAVYLQMLLAEVTEQMPSRVHKPRVFLDGDTWCALYGDDLQVGVAGFGETPALAVEAFDKAWVSTRRTQEPKA